MDFVKYIDNGDSVILYRCYGSETEVSVPGIVAGKPVKMIADHCFAEEPSVKYSPARIRTAVWSEGIFMDAAEVSGAKSGMQAGQASDGTGTTGDTRSNSGQDNSGTVGDQSDSNGTITAPAELCGSKITALWLPEGVEEIGNYAFYGCYSLRYLSVPSTAVRLGYGVFNAAPALRQIFFELPEASTEEGRTEQTFSGAKPVEDSRADKVTPPLMDEVLSCVTYEVEAVVRQQGRVVWKAVFPEYYEAGEENTPARIIEIKFVGTGYQYRQCFLSRVLQFDRYDDLFYLATAQHGEETDIHLALDRLEYPLGLSPEAEKNYVEYLQGHPAELAACLFPDEQIGKFAEDESAVALEALAEKKVLTLELTDTLISRASQLRRADAVSRLMEIRHSLEPAKKKHKFDLDDL